MTAKKHGLDVVVVEKAPVFGGTTAFSGGVLWIPGNGRAPQDPRESRARAKEYLAAETGNFFQEDMIEAFLDTLSLMRAPRRRDGATFWRVYRDLADPSRYVERFIVTSWADYLHQRARATMADQDVESRVRAFMLPGETVTMQHFIAER